MCLFCRSHRLRTRSSIDSSWPKRLSARRGTRLPLIRLYDSLAGKDCIARVMYVCKFAHTLHTHTRINLCIWEYEQKDMDAFTCLCICLCVCTCIGTIRDIGVRHFFVQLPYSCFLTVRFVCNAGCEFFSKF